MSSDVPDMKMYRNMKIMKIMKIKRIIP